MSVQMHERSVVLIEDHRIFIEGLSSVLQKFEGISVVASFTQGMEALEYLRDHPVDIIFLDIALPDITGTELCRLIKQHQLPGKIIALSNHTEKQVINEMLANGANGYLLKNTSLPDLRNAIEQVILGQCVLSDEVRQIVFSATDDKTKPIPRLTAREKEVLHLISEGFTTTEMAEKLFISTQTVETHRHNLIQKFKVSNAATLIRKAMELGFLKTAPS